MNNNPALTKFEQDLKDFFPDIFKLHIYSKSDKFLWKAIYAMLEYRDKDETGELLIRYNTGRIERIYKGENLTANEATAPNLNKVGKED